MVGASGFEPLTTRTPSVSGKNEFPCEIGKYWISQELLCRDVTQFSGAFRSNNRKLLTKVLTKNFGEILLPF
jgi:hypothetical protein